MGRPDGLRRVSCLGMALLGFAGASCTEDSPSGPQYFDGVRLEAPLTLDWPGKDSGAPFTFNGIFYARAHVRVRWEFRLEGRPADPDDPRYGWTLGLGPPLYKQSVTFQEVLLFHWNIRTVFAGRNAFAPGDTCTATVRVRPELATGEEAKAVFTFVIGDYAAGGEESRPGLLRPARAAGRHETAPTQR